MSARGRRLEGAAGGITRQAGNSRGRTWAGGLGGLQAKSSLLFRGIEKYVVLYVGAGDSDSGLSESRSRGGSMQA